MAGENVALLRGSLGRRRQDSVQLMAAMYSWPFTVPLNTFLNIEMCFVRLASST
jgi:hypothetical protein